tara:strand:- start:102 stop:1082 length:981 start_codon:yes stop_codon:yes gene_type:complete
MSKILILGAGAMGSAFTFPCTDNGNNVSLIGTPLENDIIDELNNKNKFHKILDCTLPEKLEILKIDKLSEKLKEKPDLLVIAVNSKGIEWASKEVVKNFNIKTSILLLTKGLTVNNNKFEILTDKFKFIMGNNYRNLHISAVAGPCLAKDLAKKIQSSVVFANTNIELVKNISKLISTEYYFIEHSKDLYGVEMCAAIKNFYSMIIGSAKGLNEAANLMQKSIFEMVNFTKALGGKEETVYGLSGLGDLYVSSAGGRNSKMGKYLGDGYVYSKAKSKFMPNETVEGAELAFEIGPKILKDVNKKKFPLMYSLVDSLYNDKKLEIKW